MNNIKRIAIIGNAGSGKSVLTQKLHTIFNLPVYHLDQYFWKPGWVEPNREEYKKIHDALCDKESWIIDGMNLRFFEYRLQRADIIIFLDLPRYQCIWRILKRTWSYYGKETPSSAQGCPEKFNWAFLKFLKWVWNFKKKYPVAIMKLLNEYADTKEIYILKSQQEIDTFIQNVKQEFGV
jgi:adenylate kinase family enzyme